VTPLSAASLYASPNLLAPHYARFRVSERLLLSGHSHQAWPDCSERGQLRAWSDAARHVDDKWQHAFERAERVRRGFAQLMAADPAQLSLGASTHELLVRFLSGLPLRTRPRLVTTDAEFHSARRLLQRLAEEGVELVRVPAQPCATVSERLAAQLDARTAAVIVSSVFFDSGERAGGLGWLAERCEQHGTRLLVDVYHQLNVVPLALEDDGLSNAYIVGGGYKYCQLGEGNCFLRAPAHCDLRPVATGWFAEFDALEEANPVHASEVRYGSLRTRFAGATYDPTSHYRAAEVFDFFERMQLTASLLREVSQHQLSVLCRELDALDLPRELLSRSDLPLEQRGGFLALHSPRASELVEALHARGVHCDARGRVLRLGPAPYLSDSQLCAAVRLLGEVAHALA